MGCLGGVLFEKGGKTGAPKSLENSGGQEITTTEKISHEAA
jgi:hypothetical protein